MIATSEWAARLERELTANILPFWMRHSVDREDGGFYGPIDCNLQVDPACAARFGIQRAHPVDVLGGARF